MADLLRPSRVSCLVLPVLLSLIYLVSLRAAAISHPLRHISSRPCASQHRQDPTAFVGQWGPFWGPRCGGAVKRSSALGSLPSFFWRPSKTSSGATDGGIHPQPRQQQHPARIDLYRLVGVAPDASASTISARANELQRQLQQLSDVRPAPADRLLTSLVREATAVLQDTQQRAAFDSEGLVPASFSALLDGVPVAASASCPPIEQEHEETETPESQSENEGPGSDGHHDLFSALFGGGLLGTSLFPSASGVPRGGLQPQRGPDVEATVRLGFVAAALQGSAALPVAVQRLEECDACGGTGGAGGSKPSPCKACEGRGLKTQTKRSAFGIVSSSITCSGCGGLGYFPPPRCGSCGGHGRQQKTATLRVSVPAGVSDGTLLTVEGEGSSGRNGGAPGNLYLTVRVEEDSRFSRDGPDVHSQETVTLREAAWGGTKVVETLEGKAELTIPPNAQPGQTLVLKGKGAKVLGDPLGRRGDHLVTLSVTLPEKASEEEIELLKRLRETQGQPGRKRPGDDVHEGRQQ